MLDILDFSLFLRKRIGTGRNVQIILENWIVGGRRKDLCSDPDN